MAFTVVRTRKGSTTSSGTAHLCSTVPKRLAIVHGHDKGKPAVRRGRKALGPLGKRQPGCRKGGTLYAVSWIYPVTPVDPQTASGCRIHPEAPTIIETETPL
jgi:hypothetical protein